MPAGHSSFLPFGHGSVHVVDACSYERPQYFVPSATFGGPIGSSSSSRSRHVCVP
jgi:hypothetical protein